MILITRPNEDSTSMANDLHALGLETYKSPLFEIVPINNQCEPNNYEAFVFTSKNAIRTYQKLFPFYDKPTFTIGTSSGELARQHGFSNIFASDGDTNDLVKSINAHKPKSIIHFCGEEAVTNFPKCVIYKKKPIKELPTEAIDKITNDKFSGVTFMSPQTVEIFNTLIHAHNLDGHFENCTAYCISKNTANILNAQIWKKISIAESPNQLALIRKIAEDQNAQNRAN